MRQSSLFITGLLIVLGSAPAAATSIVVSPVATSIDIGQQVSVTLVVSGLVNLAAPALGAFDIDVAFNPGVLGLDRASYGDPTLGDQLDPTALAGVITATTPGVGTV